VRDFKIFDLWMPARALRGIADQRNRKDDERMMAESIRDRKQYSLEEFE